MASFEWLKSVWTIVGAMVLGVLIGMYRPGWGDPMTRVGGLYITFLVMCVTPIMLTALSSSVARLFDSPSASANLRRVVVMILSGMFVVSGVSVTSVMLVRPGIGLSESAQTRLGELLRKTTLEVGSGTTGWGQLLYEMVPENMFAAVAESNQPQILFISILLGLLLGVVRGPSTEQFIEMLDLVFKLFQKAISWSTYFLPFGILGIMAGEVARTGHGVLLALGHVIGLTAAVCVVCMALAAMVISRVLGLSLREQWIGLRRVLLFGFGTRSSLAAMPLLMESIRQLGVHQRLVNLVVPLSTLMARYSIVLIAGLALPFAAQIYSVAITPSLMLKMMLGAMFTATTTAGMPLIPAMMTLTVAAAPIGLPMEAIIPLVIAIAPIIDPIVTATAVYMNGATTVLVAGGRGAAAEADPPRVQKDRDGRREVEA